MHRRPSRRPLLILLFAAFAAASPAYARIGLVVGEPFGSFGTMMPAGHAAIYLDNLCAASPTQLRPCRPGESGVVLSRYHDLRTTKLDWMAVPANIFFYGTEDPAQSADFITPSFESELRESYRQGYLTGVAPDRIDKHGIAHPPAYGDWEEAIGAAFDRRLFLYMIDTSPEQDTALLEILNSDPDQRRYSLAHANCADFAADLLNIVLPGTFHRNNIADFHIMSPKQLARLMDAYGRAHPEANLVVYEIPQLPGTLCRSRPLRGAAETFVKTKRYLFTLLILQPEAVLASWVIYEKKGKWTPGLNAKQIVPGRLPSATVRASSEDSSGISRTSSPVNSEVASSPAQASSPPASPLP
jgi:hypothetical protein